MAVFQATGYVVARIAIGNTGMEPWLKESIKALWLGFSGQCLIVAAILLLAAWRPQSVSTAVLLLCVALVATHASMLVWFTGSRVGGLVVSAAALCSVAGSVLRPTSSAAA